MRYITKLTQESPSTIEDVRFAVDAITIINPTKDTVLIRVGGRDVPASIESADLLCPPASAVVYPTQGSNFAFGFGPPQLASQPEGMPTTATLLFSANEPLPNLGSLALSQVTTTVDGEVDANITNDTINVDASGSTIIATVSNSELDVNVTNAEIDVDASGSTIDANITNATLDVDASGAQIDVDIANATIDVPVRNPTAGTLLETRGYIVDEVSLWHIEARNSGTFNDTISLASTYQAVSISEWQNINSIVVTGNDSGIVYVTLSEREVFGPTGSTPNIPFLVFQVYPNIDSSLNIEVNGRSSHGYRVVAHNSPPPRTVDNNGAQVVKPLEPRWESELSGDLKYESFDGNTGGFSTVMDWTPANPDYHFKLAGVYAGFDDVGNAGEVRVILSLDQAGVGTLVRFMDFRNDGDGLHDSLYIPVNMELDAGSNLKGIVNNGSSSSTFFNLYFNVVKRQQ